MAIAQQRFDFLRKDMNVATEAFTSATGGKILNTTENALKMTNSELKALIDTGTQSSAELLKMVNEGQAKAAALTDQAQKTVGQAVNEATTVVNNMVTSAQDMASEAVTKAQELGTQVLDSAAGAVSSATSKVWDSVSSTFSGLGDNFTLEGNGLKNLARDVKGMIGSVRDIAGLPDDLLSELSKTLGGGLLGFLGDGKSVNSAGIANDLKKLLKGCSGASSALATGLPGKPYSPSINCSGNEVSVGDSAKGASCNTGAYGDLFGKLTGGDYQSTYRDLNKALQSLIGLSNLGYGAGMCGVFGALSKNLPDGVLVKAGAVVAATVASQGNTAAVHDMAKQTTGRPYVAAAPNLNQTFVANYNASKVKQVDTPSYAESSLGAMELFDPNYNVSEQDGMLSAAVAEMKTEDFVKFAASFLSNRSTLDLDELQAANDDFMIAAMAMV